MFSEALIIGSGVIGVTTGLELQRRGFDRVRIVAEHLPQETTSVKAGAVFEPYKPGNMLKSQMIEFTKIGLRHYQEIIENYPEAETGIRLHDLYAASRLRVLPEEIPYIEAMPSWKFVESPNVPGEYASAVLFNDIPFIDPTKALPWLAGEFTKNGGSIERIAKIDNLEQIPDLMSTNTEFVFNCTGLGAKALFKDSEMNAMRGQIVVVDWVPEDRWSLLGDDVYYVFPREKETVLGGTAEEGEWMEEALPETISKILEKAYAVRPEMPQGDELKIKRTYGGLRPYRSSGPRIERMDFNGCRQVVSTGFGGSGWTFCWGAAESAVDKALNN